LHCIPQNDSDIIRQRRNSQRKVSVNFCSHQKNHREIVEKNQEDQQETSRTSIATHKMGDIKGEQNKKNFQTEGSNYRAAPTMAKAQFLMGNDTIDDLKK